MQKHLARLIRHFKYGKVIETYEIIHQRTMDDYLKKGVIDNKEFDSFVSTLSPKEKKALQDHMLEYLK